MASVKQSWINKYGEEIGQQMWEERKKLSACNLNSFIKKYGIKIGTDKYEMWKKNLTKSKTLGGYIDKYGEIEGKRRYEEKNSKLSISIKSLKLNGKTDEEISNIRKKHANNSKITLETLKEKYGEEDGEKRWNNRINKAKLSSKRSLDYWMLKNNNVLEKAKLDLSNYQRHDKNFYINRYGSIKGIEKYEDAKKKRFLGGFIEPCSKFQKEVEEYIKTIYNGYINRHENCYCFLADNSLKQSIVIPDILIKDLKLIVECFGDYWHCSKKYDDNFFHEVIKKSAKEIRQSDADRIHFFKKEGYDTLIIWENDWNKNQLIEKEKINYEINKKRNM
jgi:hypothetical protein